LSNIKKSNNNNSDININNIEVVEYIRNEHKYSDNNFDDCIELEFMQNEKCIIDNVMYAGLFLKNRCNVDFFDINIILNIYENNYNISFFYLTKKSSNNDDITFKLSNENKQIQIHSKEILQHENYLIINIPILTTLVFQNKESKDILNELIQKNHLRYSFLLSNLTVSYISSNETRILNSNIQFKYTKDLIINVEKKTSEKFSYYLNRNILSMNTDSEQDNSDSSLTLSIIALVVSVLFTCSFCGIFIYTHL
jgi:hypothetical protein